MVSFEDVKSKLKVLFQKFKDAFKEKEARFQLKLWQDIILMLLGAFVLELVIEVLARHSLQAGLLFIDQSTKVYVYNSLLIFVTTLPALLFRKRSFFRILFFVVWLLLGIANSIILANRVTPFTGPDFKNLTEGGAIVTKYLNGFEIVLAVILFVCLIVFLLMRFFRSPKVKGKMYRLPMIGFTLVMWLGFAVLTKVCINYGIIATYFGNIAFAYQDYGFPYCFSVTLVDTGIKEPDNYSQTLIDKIQTQDSAKEETTLQSEDAPNIIVVQLESFFDPTRVKYLKFNEDPIPNWHALASQYSSGYYVVPTVGAGTANTEFETLTGMSLHFFGAGEYPFKSVLKDEVSESSAFVLRKLGYQAYALHDNEANFYSRRVVYKNLGFEGFVSGEYMQGQDDTNANGWMRDRNLITPIQEVLDSSKGADYIFTVSVQPHGAYPSEQVIADPTITVKGAPSTEKKNAWEYYVNELHEEDQFVKDLIDSVNERNEKTIILFYGDHLPTMGLSNDDLSGGNIYETNYLIWDNFGLTRKTDDLISYQALAEVMNRIGIHEGTMFKFQQANMGATHDNFLANMQALQYDLLYGDKYAYHANGENIYEPYPFYRLGIENIKISDTQKINDDLYYIKGDNFTMSCKVFIDGEEADTTWVSKNMLLVQSEKMSDTSVIQVGVESNSSTHKILSWSFKYQKQLPTPAPSPTTQP